ncbi:MAG: DUF4252 domain-containing protein [Pyrinomonadaceae bacterium]
MKRIVFFILTFVCFSIFANAQDAKLNLDSFNNLEAKASDTVEVNLDGKILETAKRVLFKIDDKDAKTVGEVIKGLQGVYVRAYSFEKDNEFSDSQVEAVRSQLEGEGWQRLARVRSKKENQKVDVLVMYAGENITGLAVLVSEKRQIVVVNVVGEIDLETLMALGGKMNIPELTTEEAPAQ